jgi:CubicO group peptidase (beta-lactamase class C family)
MGRRRSLVRTGVAILTCLTALACSGGGSGRGSGGGDAAGTSPSTTGAPAEDVVYPGVEWDHADAAEMGFDQARLDAIASQAEQSGSNCLLVSRKGKIVGEWYWQGTDATSSQEVFSATKSYASTLVGIAQDEGKLDIDDPASDYITAWKGTGSQDVTIANLLSNDSGRQWDQAIDYGQLPFASDMDALAVGLTQTSDPGTTWAYNNAAIQTLDVVLEQATGEDTATFAADKLLGPIGMDHSRMTTDRAGNTRLFMGLQSTCEDMARFGYLFLRDGSWDGTQVVPADWVTAATGAPSQPINDAYGYLWWLNQRGTVLSPIGATTMDQTGGGEDTQLAEGAPEDMYFALGLGGQIIAVDPGSETVVVRLAPFRAPAGAPAFDPAAAASVVTDAYLGEGSSSP